MAEMNGLEFEIRGSTIGAIRSIQKLKSALSGINPKARESGKNMNLFSSAIKKATSPVANFAKKLSSIVPSFRRILLYRMIRSVIREIGDAFKYGVNNLYAWSAAADGRFAASMDRITTSMNYFKNSIGAAVAPIINALAPAIDYLVDKIVVLLNAINQLFAKLTGATYWTKATKQASSYADAAGSAGSAAKEALRYLAPFDELNVLPSDTGSSGGGGGGGASDTGGLFEIQEAFSESIANFADMVKAAWDSGDWEEVGTYLGNKVNELVANIPWAEAGKTFGKGINAIIGTEYWTLETINFENIGSSIAEFVNNAIANINFDIAGRLPVRKLTAIIDTILGFLGGLDWASIGTAISDFIGGALSEATEWVNSKDWEEIGQNIVTDITNLIEGLDSSDTAKALAEFFKAVLKAAWNLSLGVMEEIGEKLQELTGGKVTWVLDGQAYTFDLEAEREKIENAVTASNIMLEIAPTLSPTAARFMSSVQSSIDSESSSNPVSLSVYVSPLQSSIEAVDAGYWQSIIQENAPNYFGTAGLTLDLNANLVGITDNIPDSQRHVTSHADVKSMKDDIPVAQKIVETKANFTSYKKGFGSYVDAKANLTDYKREWGKWINAKANLTTYSKGWGKWVDAKANLTTYHKDWGNWINAKANMTDYYRDWSGAPYINAKANITSATANNGNGISVGGGLSLWTQALGGAFFGGKWHDIPQYASGTLNAGSMFVAGEAGPELVGHINGRTEVLNASQIASAIAAGVSSASYGTDNSTGTEDVLYRAFVRALSDTSNGGDIYLDGEKIYQSVAKHNRQNTRATGVNQLAMA